VSNQVQRRPSHEKETSHHHSYGLGVIGGGLPTRHARSYGNTPADEYAPAHEHADGHRNGYQHADGDANFDPNSDPHTDRHAHANRDSYGDPNPSAYHPADATSAARTGCQRQPDWNIKAG